VPEVSVVIPTKDRWALLSRHGLRGALAQKDVDLEVVVVDDGSTDGTPERLEALGEPRIRVVRHGAPRGQAAARNSGIAEARADWLAFLDDDDVWAPGKLRAQLDAARAGGAVFVYGPIVVLDENGSVQETVPAPDPETVTALLETRNALRAGSSTILARTDVVRELGGFDVRLSELTDWDLWLRLAQAGPAAMSHEILAGYFTHPQNRRVVDDSDVAAEYEYFVRKHPEAGAGRAHFSRWVAMGHLRAGHKLRASSVYLASSVRDRDVGNVVRAVAALFGERAFRVRRRLVADTPDLAWLDLYRD
jgi:glycosyltransferase involved in cell wall biosynthesis